GKLAESSWLRGLVRLPSRGCSFREGARNRHPPCPFCTDQTDRPAGFISPLAILPTASDRPGEKFQLERSLARSAVILVRHSPHPGALHYRCDRRREPRIRLSLRVLPHYR